MHLACASRGESVAPPYTARPPGGVLFDACAVILACCSEGSIGSPPLRAERSIQRSGIRQPGPSQEATGIAPACWPLAGERHDPIRLPRLASISGKRLLEAGRIRCDPGKAVS